MRCGARKMRRHVTGLVQSVVDYLQRAEHRDDLGADFSNQKDPQELRHIKICGDHMHRFALQMQHACSTTEQQ